MWVSPRVLTPALWAVWIACDAMYAVFHSNYAAYVDIKMKLRKSLTSSITVNCKPLQPSKPETYCKFHFEATPQSQIISLILPVIFTKSTIHQMLQFVHYAIMSIYKNHMLCFTCWPGWDFNLFSLSHIGRGGLGSQTSQVKILKRPFRP